MPKKGFRTPNCKEFFWSFCLDVMCRKSNSFWESSWIFHNAMTCAISAFGGRVFVWMNFGRRFTHVNTKWKIQVNHIMAYYVVPMFFSQLQSTYILTRWQLLSVALTSISHDLVQQKHLNFSPVANLERTKWLCKKKLGSVCWFGIYLVAPFLTLFSP